MYIKGGSRRSIKFWAKHLKNAIENERVTPIEIRGLAAQDLASAMREMEQNAELAGSRCKNFMYIASFNPPEGERLSEREWERMFEIFMKHRGIPEDQPRVVYEHQKKGRIHRHVVWQRVDLETGRAFADGHDFVVAEVAAREIALELGLEHTPGLLERSADKKRQARRPKAWEMVRGSRSGIDARDVTAEVTAIFRESRGPADLVAGLQLHGYELVTGRRGLCILDGAGDVHSLARRIEGVNKKHLDAFMAGMDMSMVPSYDDAKARLREKRTADREADLDTVRQEIAWEEAVARAAIEKEKSERRFVEPADRSSKSRGSRKERWPLAPERGDARNPNLFGAAAERSTTRVQGHVGLSARIDEVFKESEGNRKAFRAGLNERGIDFAIVSKEEAERSQKESTAARQLGRSVPAYRTGEIVAVTEPRPWRHREGEWAEPSRVHRLDQGSAKLWLKKLGVESRELQSVAVTRGLLEERGRERAEKWRTIRMKNATRPRGKTILRDASLKAPIRAMGMAANIVGKPLELVGSLFEDIFAPKLTPKQRLEGEVARMDRETQAERRQMQELEEADRRRREREPERER